MRLAQFFDAIGPFLEGRVPVDKARALLYAGDRIAMASPDANRISIYAYFCRTHRYEALSEVYATTRAVIEAAGGARRWEQIVEAYFLAHPMHHIEINENGNALATFLAAESAQGNTLPAFAAELADFEWWEWRTRSAVDDQQDANPRQGITRLASTVELRPYRFDFVSWFDDEEREEVDLRSAPAPKECLVLFWRDPDLDLRRELALPIELAILKAIVDGELLSTTPAADAPEWENTLEDLRAAGIVLGAVD